MWYTTVEDVEVFHRGNEGPKKGRGTELHHSRKIWPRAWDSEVEPSATCPWKRDKNIRTVEEEVCFMERLQLRCAIDELGELWSVEYRRIEKDYIQVVK
jgi:hypothetical protein